MKTMTKVIIKRTKRSHPAWTDEQLFARIREICDARGPYHDIVTLLDVHGVVASMPEYQREGTHERTSDNHEA